MNNYNSNHKIYKDFLASMTLLYRDFLASMTLLKQENITPAPCAALCQRFNVAEDFYQS